ncbi:MAG: HAD family hydrolase [Spirochaetaceae bacterium]|jgi:putative hydrolase of the HAD superfamily|nr:HAD family hydrolase [Spirochaetaceae bacterium]
MKKNFDGVAFDLDGTLYPNYRFYVRLLPFFLKELPFLMAMGKARSAIRAAAGDTPFYDRQARIMAEVLREDPAYIRDRTEKLIYRGWEPVFKKIKLCAHVRETLQSLRDAGLKLGLLSDFPPDTKLDYLGLSGYWDTVLCSEATNRLKPDPLPFLELIKNMALPPERILYVGNSVSYDIIGAKRVGMKTALFCSPLRKILPRRANADFVFSGYRQLCVYVLR